MDGTTEDFSYHKCVIGALEIIDPLRAKSYESKWGRKAMNQNGAFAVDSLE